MHSQLGMYYTDLPGQFNDLGGKPFLCDMFKQDRYLLSGRELSIEVHPNDNKFLLMRDGTEYKVIVEDLRWYVWKVKPQQLNLNVLLKQNTAKYPVRRVKMVTRNLAPNSLTIIATSIFTGQLPRTVAVVMVDAEGFNGSLRKDPYQFQHCDVSEIALKYGDEYVPRYALRCDWDA